MRFQFLLKSIVDLGVFSLIIFLSSSLSAQGSDEVIDTEDCGDGAIIGVTCGRHYGKCWTCVSDFWNGQYCAWDGGPTSSCGPGHDGGWLVKYCLFLLRKTTFAVVDILIDMND